MSSSINNLNPNTITLDVGINIKNLIYIMTFRLLLSIAQYINTCLIFYNVYISDFITAFDIEIYS